MFLQALLQDFRSISLGVSVNRAEKITIASELLLFEIIYRLRKKQFSIITYLRMYITKMLANMCGDWQSLLDVPNIEPLICAV